MVVGTDRHNTTNMRGHVGGMSGNWWYIERLNSIQRHRRGYSAELMVAMGISGPVETMNSSFARAVSSWGVVLRIPSRYGARRSLMKGDTDTSAQLSASAEINTSSTA